MFEIKEGNGLYFRNTEDQEPEKLYGFRSQEETQDRKYTLYLYVEIVNGILYGKFGEAKAQSCFARYNQTGGTQNKRMIALWESDKGDKEIHQVLHKLGKFGNFYHWAGEKDVCPLNTNEAYIVESPAGLEKLISDISNAAENKPIIKEERTPWPDVMKVVDEVVDCPRKDFILDLCTRWGKTGTVCNIILKAKERVNIMCSYIGTVRTSYSDEIASFTNYNDILFVDPDNFETSAECIATCFEWLKLDPNHKIFYYLALTGDKDSCFDRRAQGLDTLRDFGTAIFIEEADFGATCDLQAEKIESLKKKMKYKKLYFTTGTSAEKCEGLTKDAYRVYRDYIADVLAKRKQGVKINWKVLNNSGLVESLEDYENAEMENFSEMFTVVNGKLKGEAYFRELFTFLFKKTNLKNNKELRKLKTVDFIDPEAATIIFTAGKIEAHEPLKKIIEQVFDGNAEVVVLNGENTTNKEAEEETKLAIKNANGKPVFIISAGMATRSYSVPQIKNVILLTNGGSFATVQQKIARGLTPWNESHSTCNIIDFRLSYSDDCNLRTYLEGMATNKIDDNEWTDNLIEGIEACDKLTFFEYFKNDIPIRELSKDELKTMMETMSYGKRKAIYFFSREMDNIRQPKVGDIDEELKSIKSILGGNLKGTSSTLDHLEKSHKKMTDEQKAEKKERDQKLQHLAFLFNHPTCFDSGRFDNEIIFNEFKNMSETRKENYEQKLGIDMNTMTDIVNALQRNHVNLDSLFEE